MVCVRELKNAIGLRMENVYEVDGAVILRLRSKEEGRRDIVIEPRRRVHLTERSYKAPKQPSSFAMLLRKHLGNAEVSGVEQPRFERIIELKFSGIENRTIIAEIFGHGNIILCDQSRGIIQPHRVVVWRHRALKAGEPYMYPPKAGVDPRELQTEDLRHALQGAPDLVRGLAVNIGLGGPLAEEICARASLQKGRKPSEISAGDLDSILKAIKDLFLQELAPCIVYEDGKPVDVLPFDFKVHLGKKVKRFNTFNEALDEYFSTIAVTSEAGKKTRNLEEQLEKLHKRQSEQREQFARLYTKASEMKRDADLVAIHHAMVDDIRGRLVRLKQSKGPQGATEFVNKAIELGESWALPIKKADLDAFNVELELTGQGVELDLRLSAFENATRYYKEYKSLSEKSHGAKEAIEETENELERLKSGVREEEISPPPKRRRPKWFERYRWFVSSDGMLVIGGRDANTNSQVVEKHMEPNDRYLHAEILGAPHVVIKTGGREVPEPTLNEAAGFAAMHSRAWREGLGSLDVYWAMPGQVSKKAPSGTYLPKGSYMVQGKRNLLKVPIRAAVGVMTLDNDQIIVCGPPEAVRKHSKVMVEVYPGDTKKSELARKIQVIFRAYGIEFSVDEIERIIPPGKGELKLARETPRLSSEKRDGAVGED